MGKTNRDLGMPPELCDAWDQTIRAVFTSGQEKTVRFAFPSPEGNRNFESRMAPEFAPDGRVATVLSVGRDVTRLMEAEEEAERAAERMAELLGSISDGFFALDKDWNITYFNKAAGVLLGRDPDEVLDKNLFEAFPQVKKSIFEEKFGQAMRDQIKLNFETHFDREPYEEWYSVRVYPFEDGISVFFRMIGEEKKAEAERERLEHQLKHAHKMEAVGTLAGGIAHEFNNLLSVIIGYSEMALEDTGEKANPAESMLKILSAAERGSELVKKILTFSRKRATSFRFLDFNRAVGQAADVLKRTIPKMVDMQLQLAPERLVINGDGNQIQQVLMNLASNASDAMPDGGNLTISTALVRPDKELRARYPEMKPCPHVCLTIKDTGHGMDPGLVENVFDPFFTTKGVGAGTGLGLSIVYGIIQEHKGHIGCESTPEHGTTVFIYIPLSTSELPEGQEGEAKAPPVAGGDETILVVDDEPDLRVLATRSLESKGYKVLLARDTKEALEQVRQKGEGSSLVILDIGMPGMSGHGCLGKILEIKPEMPVLVVTGYGEDERMQNSLQKGNCLYLPKPYQRSELLTQVRSLLDKNK